MAFKSKEIVKFFGLDMKQVKNPDWTSAALFAVTGYFGTRLENWLSSTAAPASINNPLGGLLLVLAVAPGTFIARVLTQVVGFTSGDSSVFTLIALAINIGYWYLLALYVQHKLLGKKAPAKKK